MSEKTNVVLAMARRMPYMLLNVRNIRCGGAVSNPQLRPVRSKPESLTELVLEAIKDAIVGKTLAPGSRLGEATLAAQLKVSKTPVREALLRLRHIGLVESAGNGLRVIKPSCESIRDAFELRIGLERSSAFHAAVRSSASDQAGISQFATASLECAQAGDLAGFRAADAAFHRAVARGSGNQILASAINDALILTSALRQRDVPGGGYSVRCGGVHVRVAEAIRAGDADTATRQMAEHIEHVMSTVLVAATEQAASTA
jgi:GntR family transcriptional regulator, rspAB operon transcriptional repressor